MVKHVFKDFVVVAAISLAAYVLWSFFRNDYDQVVHSARQPNDFVLDNFADMMGPSLEEAVVGTGDKVERAIE